MARRGPMVGPALQQRRQRHASSEAPRQPSSSLCALIHLAPRVAPDASNRLPLFSSQIHIAPSRAGPCVNLTVSRTSGSLFLAVGGSAVRSAAPYVPLGPIPAWEVMLVARGLRWSGLAAVAIGIAALAGAWYWWWARPSPPAP